MLLAKSNAGLETLRAGHLWLESAGYCRPLGSLDDFANSIEHYSDPKQSPWLNAIEPKWVHGKRKVVEPDGLLGAYELADRVCRVFGCPHYEHLTIPREVA